MLRSLVSKRTTRALLSRNAAPLAQPLMKTQKAFYAGGQDQEQAQDLWESLYNPYVEWAPKDPYEPTFDPKKKITLTLVDELMVRLKFQTVERIDIYAFNSGAKWRRNLWSGGRSIFSGNASGFVGIGIAHATNHYLMPPQIIRLLYGDEREEHWYIGGGLCYCYSYGPVHMNAFAAYTMDELDKDLVAKELENFSEQMKSRDPAVSALGQIGHDCMQVMQEGFDNLGAKM
mmetsp:Transcript_2607/g.9956  ORF Transcript_2607/g.9956 Transcript_2607/m.9956 type:complete len:231 (-) Transcript_2607:200-892(-)|eukprot:CAMPEP_0117444562 /NCGR_PEP_ID=MMETSP0759-20121206/5307_1 /TAXON_ID=63605 /ORGANISM="Percolomonas cosmopolitus, Strain WS" /LENGTH=230 /DNA_ID=CAMNT_0005236637 /DNA_START=239 /DNA_END=931 /DNA_ORIENTATION=+